MSTPITQNQLQFRLKETEYRIEQYRIEILKQQLDWAETQLLVLEFELKD